MIRVVLPAPLRALAGISTEELQIDCSAPVTQRSVVDVLEQMYPALRGTIRDQSTHERRAFLRFFACERDLSHDAIDAPLPEEVASGKEALLVVGAIAGG